MALPPATKARYGFIPPITAARLAAIACEVTSEGASAGRCAGIATNSRRDRFLRSRCP